MQTKYKFVQDNENYFEKGNFASPSFIKLVNLIDKNDI